MATPSSPEANTPLDEELAEAGAPPAKRPDQAWREWMMVGIGWTALLAAIAVIISLVAVTSSNPHTTTVLAAAGSTPVGKPEAVKLVVKSDDEHGRRGSDGKWHDAFLPADFTVHAGDRVTVTVLNYDTSPHSFTSSSLGPGGLINQTIAAGSANAPSTTTFTFTAPSSPGKYSWWCAMPCDPWAMAHDGFMRGYVTVAA